jgi:hypothetical protein
LTPRRRYFTFSLRTLFLVLTALAVWLGIIASRASEQREVVEAIEALGGTVRYDWQTQYRLTFDRPVLGATPRWSFHFDSHSRWTHAFVQNVEEVYFLTNSSRINSEVLEAIPYLKRLRGLKTIRILVDVSPEVRDKLKAVLTDCEVT